jgi:hypothetical protein
MARWRDVVARALRNGTLAHDEAPEAEMASVGRDELVTLFADLNGPWGGCTLAFGIDDTIPETYVRGLANLLAVRLASVFPTLTPPEPETSALMRVRAVNIPYVRDMDLNEDDTTTDDEILAVDRSRYY